LQGGGVFSVVVGLYDDLHVLIEGDEEAQKALHGELAEVAARRRLKPLLIFVGLVRHDWKSCPPDLAPAGAKARLNSQSFTRR
jgi:hypothetical protein